MTVLHQMPEPIWEPIWPPIEWVSDEDRVAYERDLLCFGRACCWRDEQGVAHYRDPRDFELPREQDKR